jgi:hypothetical protein
VNAAQAVRERVWRARLLGVLAVEIDALQRASLRTALTQLRAALGPGAGVFLQATRERILGAGHPDSLATRERLAVARRPAPR